MLKDRYFYPLAAAFTAAMIWFALSKSTHEVLTVKQIITEGFVTQGAELSKLTAAPGTSYHYVEKTDLEKAYVILKTNIARKDAPASAGVFSALGPKYEQAFASHNLHITIRARQGRTNPLTHFDMGYFTADVGDSGWKRKVLSPEWQDYKIEFKPNTPKNDSGVDYLGVWPGEDGTQETMDIQSMKIDVIPNLRR